MNGTRRMILRSGGGAVLLVGIVGVGALAQPASNSEAQRELAARLRDAVKASDAQGRGLVKRLQPLADDVEILKQKVKAIEPPKSLPPPAKSEEIAVGPPSQVGGPTSEPRPKIKVEEQDFRPPLAKRSDRKTNLLVVCENGKMFLFDMNKLQGPANKAVDQVEQNAQKRKTFLDGKPLQMGGTAFNDGDYDIKQLTLKAGPTFGNQTLIDFDFEMKRKENSPGQTLEAIKAGKSTLTSRLKLLKPADNIVQIYVYPESYEIFQEIRKLLLEQTYEVGWIPLQVGSPVMIGNGKATGQ